jgi:DNA repair photolyase
MVTIYEPRGRAREYSPLALDIYNGCVHGCTYCYAPSVTRATADTFHREATPRKDILPALQRYLALHHVPRQVLLSFLSDPYPPDHALTRDILTMLYAHSVPVSVLTKAPDRAFESDLDVIRMYGKRIKVGTTLVSIDRNDEPNAPSTATRMCYLKKFHDAGVKTWVSFEPVLDPVVSLSLLHECMPYTDEFRIGKLNHHPQQEKLIDWTEYLAHVVARLRAARKPFYVKDDLAAAAPEVKLTARERDCDAMAL